MTLITDDMKTDWFPPDVKPVYPGVYETYWITPGGIKLSRGFARWIGGHWTNNTRHACDAQLRKETSQVQRKFWRGLKTPYDGQTS